MARVLEQMTHGTFSYYNGPSPADASTGNAAGSADKEATIQTLPVEDLRPTFSCNGSSFTLDINGFTAVKHSSALLSQPYDRSSWNDTSLREQIYYPELCHLLKTLTGASKLMVLGGTARTRLFKETEPLPKGPTVTKKVEERPHRYPPLNLSSPRVHGFDKGAEQAPAKKVHIDYSPKAAVAVLANWRQDITNEAADVLEAERASGGDPDKYAGRRYAMFSIWRPLKPVKRDPMATLDYQSIEGTTLVPLALKPPGIHGPFELEILLAKAGSGHRWYWIKDQMPDEVFVLKFFDSESVKTGSKIAGGVPHSSFHLENTDDEPARESLEVRLVAFW